MARYVVYRPRSVTGGLGLTLVEVLIAVAVLGLVMGAVVALQASSLQLSAASRAESDALQVAITRFETLKTEVQEASAFGELRSCPGIGQAASGPCERGPVLDDGWSVTASIAGYSAPQVGILTVRVEVDGPRLVSPVTLTQLLSCLDTVPSPTLAAPGVCNAP